MNLQASDEERILAFLTVIVRPAFLTWIEFRFSAENLDIKEKRTNLINFMVLTSINFVTCKGALASPPHHSPSPSSVLLHGLTLSPGSPMEAKRVSISYDPQRRCPVAPGFSYNDNGGLTDSVSGSTGSYTVSDFMTKKKDLNVVKPTTTVDEALETLVSKRISGFPVVDDDWNLVGVVSDYDLLALDSISGGRQNDTNMFPEVDSSWKAFNEIQKLLNKTKGQVVGDVMTPSPLFVGESTKLEDAARLLLETKYHRLPVVDSDGKLVSNHSCLPLPLCYASNCRKLAYKRGGIVRAAMRATEGSM